MKTALIIIQRSNGDVFFSQTLIKHLLQCFKGVNIDILINDDTKNVATLLSGIRNIIEFSYKRKKYSRWEQEKTLILKIFRKYDLSISLTASDRSVIYCLLSGKQSISAVEKNPKKSWWKRLLLGKFYFFDTNKHIIENNFQALQLLDCAFTKNAEPLKTDDNSKKVLLEKLARLKIKQYLVFHPCAQYSYKIYPKNHRNKLLQNLNTLNIPIIVTGSSSELDLQIKQEIPNYENIYNFIGETSISEIVALSELAICYVGMDTLNMHIAASQGKRVFAIFGPTNLKMWSPWSNTQNCQAFFDKPYQTYGEISIFQADLPCVACGKAGCNDKHDESVCLNLIDPNIIFEKISVYVRNVEI